LSMPKKTSQENLEKVEVKSHQELRKWFEKNHAQEKSIWLVTYKKVAPDKYLANTDVVDECVCFGWMDGRKMKLDDSRTMQLLSPKKTKHWAKSYKERYERLKEAGRMHDAGERLVAEAKESGDWDFMNDVDALIVPKDLAEAFEGNPLARENYEDFPDSAKRDILRWIKLAKRKETREKRIAETIQKATVNQRASGTGNKKS
ncbi:MAG: YdeI/OmpD-associated family protein, partial [Cyanobacteria bacterium P01_F01_bin.153]